jgi:hypothetical protein
VPGKELAQDKELAPGKELVLDMELAQGKVLAHSQSN